MTALVAITTEAVDIDGGNATLDVTEPAGLVVGELMLAHLENFLGAGATAPGSMSPFSDVIASFGTSAFKGRVQSRVADGTEGPTYTSTMPTSAFNAIKLLRITDAHATTPIDGSNSGSGTATSVNLPAVTTSSDYCLAICFVSTTVSLASTAQTPPAGWALGEVWTSSRANAWFWKIVPVSGTSTGTANFAFGGSAEYIISVVTVAPLDSTGINLIRIAGQIQTLTTQTATPVDMADAGSIAIGSYLIARIAGNNAGASGVSSLSTTITDPRSNTWTMLTQANQDPGAADAGATCAIAYCKVVNAYTNGDDITVNWSPTTTAKAIIIEEWAGIHATSPIAVAATTQTAATTALSIARTPTAAGQLMYVAYAIEGPEADAFTYDSDNTAGVWAVLGHLSTTNGTAASNQTIRGAAKVVTGTSAQTWDSTITSRDVAGVAVVFDFAPAPVDARALIVNPVAAVRRAARW